MFIQRCCGFQRRRLFSTSLASAGLLSCLYSRILFIPVCIETFSQAERCIAFSTLRDNRLFCTAFRHPIKRRGYIHRLEEAVASKGTSKKLISDPALRRSLWTDNKMSLAHDIPEWANNAFSVTHSSFDKIRDAYVPDLGLAVSFYKHRDTSLSVISLVTDGSSGREMCFDIVVPTPPFNDNGCPHILEHSVLEGSKNYPGKDGFSLLLQGGFQSFVNAFTDKDRTSYLFASTNEKDFYITADFYMSAIFQPSIREHERIFKQEAWHYKVSGQGNQAAPEDDGIQLHGRQIGYGGIVYSEMKKAYSDPVSRGQDYIYQRLFTNSYKFDSGGNPENIVQLQYPELVKFYETYYGPETANVYFYGPDDPAKRLAFVDEYLRRNRIASSEPPYTASTETAERQVQLESYRDTRGVIDGTFGATGTEEEDILFTGWLLDPVHSERKQQAYVDSYYKIDLVDSLGMEVLENLLIGTTESLLYRALIKAGIGKKVVGSGLTNHFNQANFIVGLSGINCKDKVTKEEARKKFEDTIMSTLDKAVQEGFKDAAVEAALNTIEFQMRELNTGSFPKGLMLVNLMHSHSQFKKDPIAALQFGTLMEDLRKRIANNRNYFARLVKKHLLENNHRVTVHMNAVSPQEFEKSYNEAIKKSLLERLGHLNEEDVKGMELEYQAFKTDCEKPEDPKVLEALPMLSLDDINHENELIPTSYYIVGHPKAHKTMPTPDVDDIIALCHPIESHGIVYLDLALSLEDLNLKELQYMDIFSSMIKEAGTYDTTPEDMSYRIASHLGGLSASFSFMTAANGRKYSNRNEASGYLYIRAKALKGKENEMLDIVLDVLRNANFTNKEKGMEIIRRRIHQIENSIISSGHTIASKRLMSRLSVADYATELCSGYEYLRKLKADIMHKAEKQWDIITSILETIREKVMQTKNVKVNITASPNLVQSLLEQDVQNVSSKLKKAFKSTNQRNQDNAWVSEVIAKGYFGKKDEVIVAPTNVNFVGMGGPLFNDEELSGADGLVMHYISSSYLWKQVRVALGAYGVFCNLSTCGDVIFMSYADPNFHQTLDVYKSIPLAIKEGMESLSDREFLRQKIGKISRLDKPLTVDAKGFTAMNRILRGETDEERQLYREDIMAATVECFNRLLEKVGNNTDWHNVCAVVNRTTASTLPSTINQLDIVNSDS